MLRRSGDDEVRLRECMTDLAPLLDQEPPFEHDILRDRQHSLLEHWADLVGEPVVEFGTACYVRQNLNAEPNLRQRDHADKEQFKRLLGDEADNLGFRFRTPKLGQDVRVEQPSHHNDTSRTGMAPRPGAISMSRWGDACMASTSAWPVALPLRRRNSSAAMTTTSSRPCTVTCCGPSLRTLRTSSLKRALAFCKSEYPERPLGGRTLLPFEVDSFDLDILVILTRITQKTRSFKEMTCWPSTVHRGLRKPPPILAKYQLDRKSTTRARYSQSIEGTSLELQIA